MILALDMVAKHQADSFNAPLKAGLARSAHS